MYKPSAICDSSVLIIFAKTGHLTLLLQAFQKPLLIEETVYQEVIEKGIARKARDAEIIQQRINSLEINVKRASRIFEIPSSDAGEEATISLSIEEKPDFVAIDDHQGRVFAKRFNLVPIGSLGILKLLLKNKIIGRKQALEILSDLLKVDYRISSKLLEEFKQAVEKNSDFLP
ncbi:MAG: DUF3368 domain-containing protein [Candidatus Micrarchaeota archaeon]|nr:DUF3368 domain-containing protein [Candidatus Micrarchaeota archaeon]